MKNKGFGLISLLCSLIVSIMPNTEILDNCELIGIERPCKAQPGSLAELWIIRAEDVSQVPSCCSSDHIISEDIQVKRGKSFVKLYFQPDKAIFTETGRESPSGSYFEQRVEIFTPGLRPELFEELCKMKGGRFILAFKLYSGERILLGSLSNPCLFLSSQSSGRSRRDQPGAELVFSRSGLCPACFIDDEIELPNEEAFPYAEINISQGADCPEVLISLEGSFLMDGTVIQTSMSSSVAELVYIWGPVAAPIYKASIAPDGDPTNINDWTYLEGSRNASQFEIDIVNQITGSGNTALRFRFVPHYLSFSLGGQSSFSLSAYVLQGSSPSNISTGSFVLNTSIPYRINTQSQTVAFIQILGVNCFAFVDWGDGNRELVESPADTEAPISHNYGAPGIYDITVYTKTESLRSLDLSGASVEGFSSPDLPELESLDLSGSSLGPSFSLAAFPELRKFRAYDSDIIEVYAPQTTASGRIALIQFKNPSALSSGEFSIELNAPAQLFIDWGDGTTESPFLAGGVTQLYSHNYPISADYVVSVFVEAAAVKHLWITGGREAIDIAPLQNLESLQINNNPTLSPHFSLRFFPSLISYNGSFTGLQTVDFTGAPLTLLEMSFASLQGLADVSALSSLQYCNMSENSLTDFKLGSQPDITGLYLHVNQLSSAALDGIIDDLWQVRASTIAFVNLSTNTGSLSAVSLDKINGTGAYIGEGLVSDYSWNIFY